MTLLRTASLTLVMCWVLALGGCGDSGDDGSTIPADTIGTGGACTTKLRQVATPEYLRQAGLGIQNPAIAERELTRAVAEVCRRGPPDLSVADAAQQVVRVIEVRFVQ